MNLNAQSAWTNRLFVLVLFLIAYAIMWFLGTSVFNAWNSPMHWLVPLAGFWLAFWAIDWVNDYFEIKTSSLWYLFVIVVIGFLAFYVSQFLYWCNAFTDIRTLNSSCGGEGVSRAFDYVNSGLKDFSILTGDAFFYFWLSVLLAWLSKIVLGFAMAPVEHGGSKKKPRKK